MFGETIGDTAGDTIGLGDTMGDMMGVGDGVFCVRAHPASTAMATKQTTRINVNLRFK
jgi:hypothetical protein